MILGFSYHPIGSVRTAIGRCVGVDGCRVARRGLPPEPARVQLILGIDVLRSLREPLSTIHSHLVVIDAIAALATIEDVEFMDSDADETRWNPAPIRMKRLREVLSHDPIPRKVVFHPDQTLDQLRVASLSSGVLDKVLTYAQRATNSGNREVLHRRVAEYLTGTISLGEVSRLTNTGKPNLASSHRDMIEALSSIKGRNLQLALQSAAAGTPHAEAAKLHGVDSFEVNYIRSIIKKFELREKGGGRALR